MNDCILIFDHLVLVDESRDGDDIPIFVSGPHVPYEIILISFKTFKKHNSYAVAVTN